MILEINFF